MVRKSTGCWSIAAHQTKVKEGTVVNLILPNDVSNNAPIQIQVTDPFGNKISFEAPARKAENEVFISWDTSNLRAGRYRDIKVFRRNTAGEGTTEEIVSDETPSELDIEPRELAHQDAIAVTMRRSTPTASPDLPLWVIIKGSADALSFDNYKAHMDWVLCNISPDNLNIRLNQEVKNKYQGSSDSSASIQGLTQKRFLPFTDSDAYRLLKVATEAFVLTNCAVLLAPDRDFTEGSAEVLKRVEVSLSPFDLRSLWIDYLKIVNGDGTTTLPYLELITRKFPDIQLKSDIFVDPAVNISEQGQRCYGILKHKLQQPCLLELIWSYWHEEGMLVQTMAAITQRFQNRRSASVSDPLANLETDPLRPLNNLLWSYVQDEIHRLSVIRRAYEYDHHYGLRIYGKAVADFRPADSRSKFLEAFHNLLNLCAKFYKQDDDTTVVADGFPLLNALRDVHLLLSEGAHNQFGDLPGTARVEMLMQQWMLARPEFREFLPTRSMVAYPEPWMDRVDAMKKLQGWTDVNVLHFRNLGVFGEQVLLSIRYGAWSETNDPKQAATWARFWRAEVQGYVHAYRTVTGVDLTTEKVDGTLPAIHLRNRLLSQMRSSQEQSTLTISRSRVS